MKITPEQFFWANIVDAFCDYPDGAVVITPDGQHTEAKAFEDTFQPPAYQRIGMGLTELDGVPAIATVCERPDGDEDTYYVLSTDNHKRLVSSQ